MLRIGICDDEEEVRNSIRFLLEKILEEETEQIIYEFSDGKTASSWIRKHPGEIDLLFLDIEMKEMSGMDAAKEIRTVDKEIMFAFVTGYTDYVYEGYQVEAIGYFIKPITLEQIHNLIVRVRDKLDKKNDTESFIFKNVDGTFRLPKKSICYLMSEKRKVHIITDQNRYEIYGKLDELEQELHDPAFVRVHNRYLVNSRNVTYIGTDSVEVAGEKIALSRAYKKEAIDKLARNLIS